MTKIEIFQAKPKVEDWAVKLNGLTIGSVWRNGDSYIASVSNKASFSTKEAAFKAAKQQAKKITAA